MDMRAPVSGRSLDAIAWTALRYFNLYRIVISGLLSVLAFSGNLPPPMARLDATVFGVAAFGYLGCAIAAQVLLESRALAFALQLFGQMLLDIAFLSLLMYASGGVASGFGILLLVAIAGGGLLSGRRSALVFAAAATLAVLGQELYLASRALPEAGNYPHAGFLGASFFIVAIVGQGLGRRIRESEALADQRAVDLASLAQLNEHIIQRMQAGILVLDAGARVRLLNASAARMLGVTEPGQGRRLAEVAPALDEQYQRWRVERRQAMRPFRSDEVGGELLASFTNLGAISDDASLIFLEDAAVTRQRAQQMKLASLGRLTASIAHEIRNPLGAISHAGQLLAENADADPADARLTQIIRDHAARVNVIIENVLQLGRRQVAVAEQFEILPWLRDFASELTSNRHLPAAAVRVQGEPESCLVRMDPSQLHQVLWNLCENALRYSSGEPAVELLVGINPTTERPFLEVLDHGSGMAVADAEHVFEPFFTTEKSGSGLGLYIASELCEANQATLRLVANSDAGCRFRIDFAHPDKQQLTVS